MTAEATLVAQADFGPRAFAIRLPGIGWLVTGESGALSVVDEQLIERARFNRRSTWRGRHWVTPDLKRAALSERDRVSMMDADGREVWTTTHHPWGDGDSESGSCWIRPDGQFRTLTASTSVFPLARGRTAPKCTGDDGRASLRSRA